MKLEKREITLNERDSLLDMYFCAQALQTEYDKGAKLSERKETEKEIVFTVTIPKT